MKLPGSSVGFGFPLAGSMGLVASRVIRHRQDTTVVVADPANKPPHASAQERCP